MADSDGKAGFLSEGSTVEVEIDGAWCEGDAVSKCPQSEDQFCVLSGDALCRRAKLRSVSIASIRPRPPPPAADQSYEPRDVVDVLVYYGWWKGVVSGAYTLKGKTIYTVVLLQNPPYYEDRVFTSEKMRFHWVWTGGGQWVRPPKPQEIPGVGEASSMPEHSNPVIDTSTCKKLNTPALETMKSNNFSKQNPEGSPATLVAMKSACDLGGNLASKGKNPSPNQQEAGLKTRVAKSSKKRPREPNAHITSQQVLAAAEVIKKGNHDQAESEIARNEDLPFKKSSYMWKEIDSLEVFKMLPQNPHFSPLKDCNEFFREGTAIGHMWTFASLVDKVSELQIDDPKSLFESYLEAFATLETVGFNVKVVVDRINELLAFKTKQEYLREMFNVKAGAPW